MRVPTGLVLTSLPIPCSEPRLSGSGSACGRSRLCMCVYFRISYSRAFGAPMAHENWSNGNRSSRGRGRLFKDFDPDTDSDPDPDGFWFSYFRSSPSCAAAHPWRMKRRLLRAATVRERIRLLTRAALSVYLFSEQQPAYGIGHGSTFQISVAYWAMVRSLENFPELATFRMALRAQALESAYNATSWRSASR
jgi:hypothetical protein